MKHGQINPWLTHQPFIPLTAYWGDRLIKDEDFNDLYSHTGRPSVSPALLSKVLLLMYHDNVSDREAEECAKYDLRWKAALHQNMGGRVLQSNTFYQNSPEPPLKKMPGLLMPMVEELVGINPVDLAHPLDSVGSIVSTDK